MRSGHLAQGPEVEALEQELAERFRPGGAACVVSSGTAALYLALKVLAQRYGGLVSIPTYACASLYHAVDLAGYGGVVDVVDCADRWSLINHHSTIDVHTYGVPMHGAIVLEDFSQAPGARRDTDDRPCGSLGELSVISFGATKPLGMAGGGAVLGSEEDIYTIKGIRDYDDQEDLRLIGQFNWTLSDVQAALVRSRLARLEREQSQRWFTAHYYNDALKHLDPDDVLRPSLGVGYGTRTFHRYVLIFSDECRLTEARDAFTAAGIETINPLRPEELLHRRLGLDPKDYPNAEKIAASTLSLPIYPGMTDDEVGQVCRAMEAI
jgi:perosamine synthetase